MNLRSTTATVLTALLTLLGCTGPAVGDESNFETCPSFQLPIVLGNVASKKIVEASGIAASHRNPGVYYTHNDSGSGARLYALDETGRKLGEYKVQDAEANDWEDIAVGKAHGETGTYIYIGDIGDNREHRDLITVYRVPEPDVSLDANVEPTLGSKTSNKKNGKKSSKRLPGAVALRMRYPDGLAYDSEALLLDPATSDLYLVTKVWSGPAKLFRYPAPHEPDKTVTLEEVGSFELTGGRRARGNRVTGGDISLVRNQIALRTHSHLHVWKPRNGQTIAETMADPPCWSVEHREREPQGEAVGWKLDGSGVLTVGEGKRPPIYFFRDTPSSQ